MAFVDTIRGEISRALPQLRSGLVAALVMTLVFGLAQSSDACPTCKNALHEDPAQQGMVVGYFYSILFMMSMPFLLIGSFGGYAYFLVRRSRNVRQPEE